MFNYVDVLVIEFEIVDKQGVFVLNFLLRDSQDGFKSESVNLLELLDAFVFANHIVYCL